VWDVKVVGVGDVVRVFFARALVRGDVDPHFSGLGAREADGGAIGIEVRASALFECLGAWINDAHACEVVCCLVVRQYVKQAEEASAYSPGGRRDCREEEEIALVVVVLVVVELLLNGGIQSSVDVEEHFQHFPHGPWLLAAGLVG
jgi:hypothetical protein